MINIKENVVSMDMRTAVNYTEVQILQHIGAFFVDTEFGRICVECNPYKTVSVTNPVTLLPWTEAPDTKFAVDRQDESADWWAGIDIYGSQITDHLTVIEMFTRAMLTHLGLGDADEDVIDAAVYLYVAAYDSYSININMIEREFIRNHLDKAHIRGKKREMVKAMARDLFMRKIDAAEGVYRKSEKFLAEYKRENETKFFDDYCKELFGIILYANNEVKEKHAYINRRLVQMDYDINVNKSIKDLLPDGNLV